MKRVSLFSNPVSCFFITFSFVGVAGLISIVILYFSHYNTSKQDLRSEANQIEETLYEIFGQTNQLMFHIGKQISGLGEKDIQSIANIIGKDKDESFKSTNPLNWMNLGWIGPDNKLIFDWHSGICPKPVDMSSSQQSKQYMKDPWKLHLSRTTLSLTSGLREIPGVMGITDDKGGYLGGLSVGFGLAEINSKIQTTLRNTQISYIILDENLRIVLQSPGNAIDPDSSYYKDLLEDISIFSGQEGAFGNQIGYKNIQYSYYKKTRNYPFYILTGFDQRVLYKEFQLLILPRVIELLALGLLCSILIYFFRRNMLSVARTSERTKANLIRQMKNEKEESLQQIIVFSDILYKCARKEIDVTLPPARQLELVENIYKSAISLDSSKRDSLNLTYLNVNSLIYECISIQLQAAFIRNVRIKSSLCSNLPPLLADELRFKQIVLGLISLSFEYSPKGGVIKVSTVLKVENDQPYLVVTLEDNGFAFDEKDIRRISERFENEGSRAFDDVTRLDFPVIEKFIKLHQGTFHLEPKGTIGKNIIVTLPFRDKEKETTLYELNRVSVNNICKFTKIEKDVNQAPFR
ncbi:MAG: HAMP domain-containing histidine kinase [Alphaproteobacteria bacterium]|nr:HAMP domain-containing histidine kinase [Alphaproteobacteria bacterium]